MKLLRLSVVLVVVALTATAVTGYDKDERELWEKCYKKIYPTTPRSCLYLVGVTYSRTYCVKDSDGKFRVWTREGGPCDMFEVEQCIAGEKGLPRVAVLFTVSWLPMGLLLLVMDLLFPPSLENNVSTENLYLAFAVCHIIAMTSAISNPVVYGWLNSNIRRELMALIPCKFSRPVPEETTAAPSPTMVLCQNGQKRHPTQPATTYTAL